MKSLVDNSRNADIYYYIHPQSYKTPQLTPSLDLQALPAIRSSAARHRSNSPSSPGIPRGDGGGIPPRGNNGRGAIGATIQTSPNLHPIPSSPLSRKHPLSARAPADGESAQIDSDACQCSYNDPASDPRALYGRFITGPLAGQWFGIAAHAEE